VVANPVTVQAVAAAAIARGVIPALTLLVIPPASAGNGAAGTARIAEPARLPEGDSYVNAADVRSALSGADGGTRSHSTEEASQDAHGAEGGTFVSTR
jgi:hypothetical protein